MNLFQEEENELIKSKNKDIKTEKVEKKIKTFETKTEEINNLDLKNNNNFFDNQNLFDNLIKLFKENKMPNSLIIEGDFGDDKIDFAFNLCLQIIAISLNEEKESIYQRFNKNIIDDILIIKNKNEKQILIDDIRAINDFVSIKSYFGNPKFIIINSIDSLNINASNCLLKNLEEPNENIFFILLYDKTDSPLKTILSRCIKFKFKKLSKESFESHLKQNDINLDNFNFYSSLSNNYSFYYKIFKENDIYHFYNILCQNISNKNYNDFFININLLFNKIKDNNHLSYKQAIISKLFCKIFMDIYNLNFAIPTVFEKYEQYIKFFQKIFDRNLNLIYYYNL